MDALRKTARDLGDPGPDTSYGWGLRTDPPRSTGSGPRWKAAWWMPFPRYSGFSRPTRIRFNPRVAIPFRVYETARMTVEVFDITGRKVTDVADGPVVPGIREAVWNAEGCAAGVYFVRAKARGFTETRRIALVK